MRLPLLLVLGGLSLGAAACATAPTAPVSATGLASSSSPAPLEDHDWFFNSADDHASLMYGAKDSDDIWVVLTCQARSGALKVLQPAVFPHPIQLESGGDTESWPAEALPDELHDLMLSASARTNEPVFLRFQRVGWLAVYGEAGRVTMAAHPGSEHGIAEFFTFCG